MPMLKLKNSFVEKIYYKLDSVAPLAWSATLLFVSVAATLFAALLLFNMSKINDVFQDAQRTDLVANQSRGKLNKDYIYEIKEKYRKRQASWERLWYFTQEVAQKKNEKNNEDSNDNGN